jgi:ribosome assembly protein YihI (activator of Der GTPase)
MVPHAHFSTGDNVSSLTAEEQTELERLEYDAGMYDSAASAADPELAASFEAQAAKAWERIAEIYQAHGINYCDDPEGDR